MFRLRLICKMTYKIHDATDIQLNAESIRFILFDIKSKIKTQVYSNIAYKNKICHFTENYFQINIV